MLLRKGKHCQANSTKSKCSQNEFKQDSHKMDLLGYSPK